MTSAIDELCRLLDEHGVVWRKRRGYIRWSKQTEYGITHYQAWPCSDETITFTVQNEYGLTPEQAIAATLGEANIDDALALLDEMNERGRIEYADYSQLHDTIATKLWRGTCHDVWQNDPFANFKCSECNDEFHYRRDKKRIACCPFCKREVVRA